MNAPNIERINTESCNDKSQHHKPNILQKNGTRKRKSISNQNKAYSNYSQFFLCHHQFSQTIFTKSNYYSLRFLTRPSLQHSRHEKIDIIISEKFGKL
jgi:hypothetical protein